MKPPRKRFVELIYIERKTVNNQHKNVLRKNFFILYPTPYTRNRVTYRYSIYYTANSNRLAYTHPTPLPTPETVYCTEEQ